MIRGDTKYFNFKIKKGSEYVSGDEFTEIEVQFNAQDSYSAIKKLLSKGEVEWNEENQNYSTFLSQEDTFKLNDGDVWVQVRVYKENNCKGTFIKTIDVGKVLSKEVLQ